MNAQSISVTDMNGQVISNSSTGLTQVVRYAMIGDHLFSELNNEAVVLSLKNGKYYGLNTVGVSIYQALQTPRTYEEIKAEIMNEYSVEEEICAAEVKSFLLSMEREGLVEVFNE